VDATATAFGPGANAYRARPASSITSTMPQQPLRVESNGFRLLINSNGAFQPSEQFLPASPREIQPRPVATEADQTEDMNVLVRTRLRT